MMKSKFLPETLAAIEVAKSAGNLLKEGFWKNYKIFSKEGRQNLVTEYDLLSEKKICSFLRKKFPSYGLLAEEGGETVKADYQWVIDPLDGTVNFAHHIPHFCISIALHHKKTVISGVIYNPVLSELFVAEKDRGAYLNAAPLHVSKTDDINQSFLATGFPYNFDENPKHILDIFTRVLKNGIPVRRIGSAALDMAYVAAGRYDGYWETGLGLWDYAAGALLIEESKGKVTKWNGSKFSYPDEGTLVASNGLIHEDLVKLISQSHDSPSALLKKG